MAKNASILAAAVVLGIGVLLVGIQLPMMVAYNKVLRNLEEIPAIKAAEINVVKMEFLDQVQEQWHAGLIEEPDKAMPLALEEAEFSQDVEGIVKLFTHSLPTYSFFNPASNEREGTRATIMAMILPVTMDNTIHHAQGLAYFQPRPDMVILHEDTDKGIRTTIYLRDRKQPVAE